MTYAVTEDCENCDEPLCVPVCPVDAFHRSETQYAIDAKVCIDCNVCKIECGTGSIYFETEINKEVLDLNLNIVLTYSQVRN